jgi:hypothetical protein
MQRFTYFLPGRAGVNKETICNAGLATIFEPEFSIQSCQVLKHGPNDGGGVAFACNDDKEGAAFARVNMHDQTWIDCGGHWIGFTTNDAPTPDDLARPEAIAALKGYTVKLGDYDWIIPSVNPNHAKPMLPYRRVPKPDGTFAIEVARQQQGEQRHHERARCPGNHGRNHGDRCGKKNDGRNGNIRVATYRAWRRGIMNDHQPSIFDFTLVALGVE